MSNQEPKVHAIDGVTYVEVDRKAKVGDYLFCENPSSIYKVDKMPRKPNDNCLTIVYSKFPDLIGEPAYTGTLGFFTVIEPVEESPDVEVVPPSVVDMLANLARRVSSLESQLSDTQRNAEWLAEELMALKYLTQSNEGDIRMIDQRTQVLDAINKYYAEGSR